MDNFPLPIPCEHPCYAAHFPGNPIVPGALLLQWLLSSLKQHYPHLRVSNLRRVKFLNVVKPGNDCQLAITEDTAKSQLKIILRCNNNLALKATLSTQRLETAQDLVSY